MRTEVMFRDLPGGPTTINLSDEVPRRSKCSVCQMISLKMYMDAKKHVFCDVCVRAASERGHIYCSTEGRNVPLAEFYDAYEVLLILRNMAAFCPNQAKGCEQVEKLDTIIEHYKKCQYTVIECKVCKEKVTGREYKQHEALCAPMMVQCPRCFTSVEKKEVPRHKCRDPEERAWASLPDQSVFPSESRSLLGVACRSDQRVQHAASSPEEKMTFQAGQKTQGPMEEKVTCELCDRQVRISNIERHEKHCKNVEDECESCRRSFRRGDMLEHRKNCLGSAPSSLLESNGPASAESKQDIQATPSKDVIRTQPRSQPGVSQQREEGKANVSVSLRSTGVKTTPAHGTSSERPERPRMSFKDRITEALILFLSLPFAILCLPLRICKVVLRTALFFLSKDAVVVVIKVACFLMFVVPFLVLCNLFNRWPRSS